MAYGSRNKLSAAELNRLGSNGDTDDTTGELGFGMPRSAGLIQATPSRGETGIIARRPNQIGDEIAKQLRDIHNNVLNEPLPNPVLELLKRLETDTKSLVSIPTEPEEAQ